MKTHITVLRIVAFMVSNFIWVSAWAFYPLWWDGQLLAQASCTALQPGSGWTFAVARPCSSSALSCAEICNHITEAQAGPLECFNSLHIYSNNPFEDTTTLGFKVYKYNSCGGGCGPNYCTYIP